MKTLVKLIAASALCVALLSGCNKQLIDTTYTFNRAIVRLPDGTVIEGKLDSWKDYDGDQLQVKINDTVYLVHSNNVVLIKD